MFLRVMARRVMNKESATNVAPAKVSESWRRERGLKSESSLSLLSGDGAIVGAQGGDDGLEDFNRRGN